MMKRLFSIIITITIILALSTVALASTVGFGARATAMGGSFTAVADDSTAVYWNPAGLNKSSWFAFTPGVGVYGSYNSNFSFDSLKNNITTFPIKIPDVNLGLPVFIGINSKFVGANLLGDFNVFLVDTPASTKIYADGSLYGTISGATTIDKLSIGASYKIVRGATIRSKMMKFDVNINSTNDPTAFIDLFNELKDEKNNSSIEATGEGYAIDIGALYQLNDKVKFGFMGRNLLSAVNWTGDQYNFSIAGTPTSLDNLSYGYTKTAYSATNSLPRTYALGVAFHPIKSTTLAGDVEIITADDSDLNVTRYHLGFEQTVFAKALSFRAGLCTNRPGETLTLSAGLGFKLGPILLDLAAAQTSSSGLGYFVTGGLKF